MKKAISVIFVLLLFVLCGCGEKQDEATENVRGESMASKFDAVIGESKYITDNEDQPILITNIEFTNNTDGKASFNEMAEVTAFQGNEELAAAYVYDSDDFDIEAADKQIEPDEALTVQCAFYLQGKDDVKVKINADGKTILKTFSFE